ncbi:ATP-binding cassette domain-containing protein [Nocardia sp. NEAU-351]|uniref:ATP-binding cassette domain-containing protein n=2 Tax=Nocardia bovistercoris TaxID=2785916 RepID=A0A931IHR5_9NOCA|nr:ATP-binding cassette domain-containing protein [Nocardia bovistercoris]
MALTILVLLPLSAFEAVGPLPVAARTLTTARAAYHRLIAHSPTGIEHSASGRESRHHERRGRRRHGRPVDHGRSVDELAAGSALDRDPSRSGHAVPPGQHIARGPVGRIDGGQRLGASDHKLATPTAHAGVVPTPGVAAEVVAVPGAAAEVVPVPRLVRGFPPLPKSRRIAVVGPSGAGKTTLLMHWAGLFGSPAPDTTFFAEDAHLFGTSVLENLRVARGDLTEAEGEKALRAVGLGDWLDALPNGMDTDLVGGAAAVSGGQRRRILLARALVAPARTLLLDEPTEHLEAEAGARLLRDLLDPTGGLVEPDRTVVVVTHQLPEDHHADLVVHLDAEGDVTVRTHRIPPTE